MPNQFTILKNRAYSSPFSNNDVKKFFKYILTQKKESLIFWFFQAQNSNPTKGDWILNI